MKRTDLAWLICTSLTLLLAAGGLFYFSANLQNSLAQGQDTDYAKSLRETATDEGTPQLEKVTKVALLAMEAEKEVHAITSELLLAMKWLAWFLVAVSVVQLVTICSLYARGKKQQSTSSGQ